MDWVATTIWWHSYTLGFAGAEGRADLRPEGPAAHRLRRLLPYLDYLAELGANGLLLGPVFASVSHGYDTLDHFRIDDRLGDDRDFDDLVAAARQRGMRLCLDGVFNHLSRDHDIVQRAVANGRGSEAGRWLRWSGEFLRLRGQPRSGRAGPHVSAGHRLCRRSDDPLARTRGRRMAP